MAKFKVGDKVVVRDDLKYGKSYGGASFARGMTKFKGEVDTISEETASGGYNLSQDPRWCFTDEMLMPYHFSKDDLQNGMVVEYRDSRRRLKLGGSLIGSGGNRENQICDYNTDLCDNGNCTGLDIMRVYKVKESADEGLSELLKLESLEMVWKRIEEEKPAEPETPAPTKKMTIAEIETALGHKIEIIAGKEDK